MTEFKCQKCKQVFQTEEEAEKHSKENKGHNAFDFKTIGVVKEILNENMCDLCGSLNILQNDEENEFVDVHLCKKCKEQLDKSMQDAKEGRISKMKEEL